MRRVLRRALLCMVIATIVPFLAGIPMGDDRVALASLGPGDGSGDGGRSGGEPGGGNGGNAAGGDGGNGNGGDSAAESGGGNGGPEPLVGALPCRTVMKGAGCSWGVPESVVARPIP
jgi:hypothetical protein